MKKLCKTDNNNIEKNCNVVLSNSMEKTNKILS